MTKKTDSMVRLMATALVVVCFGVLAYEGYALAERKWAVHDMNRPKPVVVTPGKQSANDPPSDAIVLFDGSNTDHWTGKDNQVKWVIEDDALCVTKKAGGIRTKQGFGDCQLHIEWMTPTNYDDRAGQKKGNSGVFLMSRYEVQVLDSYKNETYADGQAASLYGQTPPLVNACRPPGEWQTYDIIFTRPRFKDDGSVETPGYVTLFHNGVLVQDHTAIEGSTAHKKEAKYSKHPDKLPISLQDHGDPMKFRNIWIRELE